MEMMGDRVLPSIISRVVNVMGAVSLRFIVFANSARELCGGVLHVCLLHPGCMLMTACR